MKRNLQFLSILMAMTILLTSAVFAEPTFAEGEETIGWDGSAATEFAGGTGSEEDPYLISSAAELAYQRICRGEGVINSRNCPACIYN